MRNTKSLHLGVVLFCWVAVLIVGSLARAESWTDEFDGTALSSHWQLALKGSTSGNVFANVSAGRVQTGLQAGGDWWDSGGIATAAPITPHDNVRITITKTGQSQSCHNYEQSGYVPCGFEFFLLSKPWAHNGYRAYLSEPPWEQYGFGLIANDNHPVIAWLYEPDPVVYGNLHILYDIPTALWAADGVWEIVKEGPLFSVWYNGGLVGDVYDLPQLADRDFYFVADARRYSGSETVFVELDSVTVTAEADDDGATELDPLCSIRCVDVSGNGEFIAIGWGNNVGFFHRDDNDPLWTYETEGLVDAVVLSDDGQQLAVAYNDAPWPYELGSQGHVAFFDTIDPTLLWAYTTDYNIRGLGRRAIDMTRDGAMIVAGTSQRPPASSLYSHVGTVYLFDTTSPVPDTYPYPNSIMVVRISGNGQSFAAGSFWHDARLYDVASGTFCAPSPGPGDPYYSVALDYDETYLATGHGFARQVNLYDGSCSRVWQGATDGTHSSIVMDDAGTCILAAQFEDPSPSSSNGVKFFNTSSNAVIWSYDTADDFQHSVDMARDCGLMVSGGFLGNVHLFDHIGGSPIFSHNIGERVGEVAMSAEGDYYVAGSWAGYLYLFGTADEPRVEWSWESCPAGDDEDEDEDEGDEDGNDGIFQATGQDGNGLLEFGLSNFRGSDSNTTNGEVRERRGKPTRRR